MGSIYRDEYAYFGKKVLDIDTELLYFYVQKPERRPPLYEILNFAAGLGIFISTLSKRVGAVAERRNELEGKLKLAEVG